MIGKGISLLLIALFAILTTTSCSSALDQSYDDPVPDMDYIRIAGEADETQAFLDQYPDADISVDRSSELSVDFRLDKAAVIVTDPAWEGIRLRVFIDREEKRVANTLIECKNKTEKPILIAAGLIEYIEQYAKNQTCP